MFTDCGNVSISSNIAMNTIGTLYPHESALLQGSCAMHEMRQTTYQNVEKHGIYGARLLYAASRPFSSADMQAVKPPNLCFGSLSDTQTFRGLPDLRPASHFAPTPTFCTGRPSMRDWHSDEYVMSCRTYCRFYSPDMIMRDGPIFVADQAR